MEVDLLKKVSVTRIFLKLFPNRMKSRTLLINMDRWRIYGGRIIFGV